MRTERKILRLLKQAPDIPVNVDLFRKLQEQIPDFRPSGRTGFAVKIHPMALPVTITAAVILIAVLLGHSLLPVTGTAYEISDLPDILKRAETLHITGEASFPVPEKNGAGTRTLALDYWFDAKNGRYMLRKPAGFDEQTGMPVYYTTVSDGRYLMEEVHSRDEFGQKRNFVRYTRLSPFQAKLDAYRNSYQFLMRLLGSHNQLKRSLRNGREVIGGETYDIWRNEWFDPDGRGTRVQAWISRKTGSVGKITFHMKSTPQREKWMPYLSLDKFEMNATPPENVFSTDTPEGFGRLNSREDAPDGELGIGTAAYGCREYALFQHIGFTLRDGCVLIAWSCRNKNTGIAKEAFNNLIPGGPLPVLPAVIASIAPDLAAVGLSYTGYHFTTSVKNGICYEWALYIPNRQPPRRDSFRVYRTGIVFAVDRTLFKTYPNALSDDLVIDSVADFEKWVKGAFSELNDRGTTPADFSYRSVERLIKKKQASTR